MIAMACHKLSIGTYLPVTESSGLPGSLYDVGAYDGTSVQLCLSVYFSPLSHTLLPRLEDVKLFLLLFCTLGLIPGSGSGASVGSPLYDAGAYDASGKRTSPCFSSL